MQPFDYIVPKDYQEASELLAAGNGSVRPLQGGTDLLIRIRGGFVRPERVIDLKSLPGMRDITLSADGWLVVGAACTMNQVGQHPLICERYDVLAQGANSVASYQLRNRATIGGNCCNASPAADTAPALLCLEAVAEVFGANGPRRIPINDFFTGPGRTAMQKGEFLTGIHLPPHGRRPLGRFLQQAGPDQDRRHLGGQRGGELPCWATAGRTWRLAIGAAGPTPLRAPEAEAALAAGQHGGGRGPGRGTRFRSRTSHRRHPGQRGLPQGHGSGAGPPRHRSRSGGAESHQRSSDERSPSDRRRHGMKHRIQFTVNGEAYDLEVPSHYTLLRVLREQLVLTGTKNGCEAGECGACAVLMNGEPVNSCMVLAPEANGASITTIEGLATTSSSTRSRKPSSPPAPPSAASARPASW